MAKDDKKQPQKPKGGRRGPLIWLQQKMGLRRVPVIRQMSATECGAASLAMVLGYWGRRITIDELRETISIGRDGTNALTILEGATTHGLRGRGVKIELKDLKKLPRATILHWNFAHFVVFSRVLKDGVEICDPAFGRRRLTFEEFGRSFTGVALLFEPTSSFKTRGKRSSHFGAYVRRVLIESGVLRKIILTSLMLEVFGLAGPTLVKQISDRVIPRGDAELLLVLTGGMVAVTIFQTLTNFVRSYLFIHLRSLLSLRMSLGFVDHLVRLPYSFFQLRPAGDLMMRLNSNDTIRQLLTSSTLSTLLDGVLVFIYLGIILFVSRIFACLVLLLTAFQIALFIFGKMRQKELLAESLQQRAEQESYEVEMFTGIETLKATGFEDRAVQRWSDLFINVMNNSISQGKLSAMLDAMTGVLTAVNSQAPLVFGTFLALSGQITFGTLLMLNTISGSFLSSVSKLCSTAMSLQILGAYVERIDDILDAPPEQKGEARPAPRLRGRITLKNVSFRYSDVNPLVVSNVSCEIQPGQFIAVVGRSGAGKSTMANLLLGLFQPTEGSVAFDGVDLADMDLRSVRRQLGIVTQGHSLFAATIRENISMFDPNIPLEDVVRAAQMAQIHDDIINLPLGYNTVLSDRGHSMSGGQRQRLALARALVRRPAILLLDEATSALDATTEKNVQTALNHLRCTRIVIAHRLSTVMSADVIVVMDRGTIAEVGSHRELVRKKGGMYAALVAAQQGAGANAAIGG